MLILFSCFLIIIGILLCWKQAALFLLIPKTPKNSHFIMRYSSLLCLLGVVGMVLYFFHSDTFTLFYVGIVLCLSGFFSVKFAKKMQETTK